MTMEVTGPYTTPATGEVGLLQRSQLDFEILGDEFFGYDAILRPASRSAVYEGIKRVIDVVGAMALFVVLLPLIVPVALWIKLTDYGPILFSQMRVGCDGKEFKFYKFRSMVPNADARKEDVAHLNHHLDQRTFKIPNDPRTTAVGRWIRRFSIDEIPQLWNVMRGDMSLVGPRPPVPKEVELYTRFDRRRFEIKPGLTCVWQVCGRGNVGFDQQILMDVDYIDHRSLLLDMKLMVLTIPAVFSGRGAY